jgi:hypothetical protein
MEHPLIGNINNLEAEELSSVVTQLNKKLAIAYRIGNHDLCNQLRMAIESYQNKYQEKLKKNQKDTGYDGMIDVS